jgi:serine/threonine protein kinase
VSSTEPSSQWPNLDDFTKAILARDFCDARLRKGELKCSVGKKGRKKGPLRLDGALAWVYGVTDPDDGKTTAVRVFKKDPRINKRAERLRIIESYLRKLGPARPDFLVDFCYQEKGIRVNGVDYPVSTMSWVDGEELGTWYDRMVSSKNKNAIKDLASRWRQLIADLQKLEIAHGDLQGRNVKILSNGSPVLIDYDGMCVPALNGKPCFELGHPDYIHPRRTEIKDLSLRLDDFPAWIILIALQASVADPTLRKRCSREDQEDNLLFTVRDLTDPDSSNLWPELIKSPDNYVREWSKALKGCLGSFDAIPPFVSKPAPRDTPPPPRPQPSQPPSDREELKAKARDAKLAEFKAIAAKPHTEYKDREFTRLWDDDSLGLGHEVPLIQSLCQDARQRLNSLKEMRERLKKNDKQKCMDISKGLPSDYEYELRDLVRFFELLGDARTSDDKLADSWNKLRNEHPDKTDFVPEEDAIRCELAVISQETKDAYEQDRIIEELWGRRKARSDGGDIEPQRVSLARIRLREWRKLEKAIQSNDAEIIGKCLSLPELHEYPPIQNEIGWLAGLRKQFDARHSHLALTPDLLFQIRIHAQKIDKSTRRKMKEYLEQQLWVAIGLKAQSKSKVIVRRGYKPMIEIRWTFHPEWEPDFVLAIDSKKLDREEDVQEGRKFHCTFHEYKHNRKMKEIPFMESEPYVTIWPQIHLDFGNEKMKLIGTPVHLGPFRVEKVGVV